MTMANKTNSSNKSTKLPTDDLKKSAGEPNNDSKNLDHKIEIDEYANFVTWECSFFRLGPIMSCTLPCWSWQVILLNKYSYCLTLMIIWMILIAYVYFKILNRINIKILKVKDRIPFILTYLLTFPIIFYGFLILYTRTIHSLLVYFLS